VSRFLSDPHLFVKVILFLYVCASIRYLVARDYGRFTYWIAAALITTSVTFLIKHD
jgi:hypothetical protein